MSFVRWIFYDGNTGEVKYSGMQQGDFDQVPVEEAAAAFGVEGAACMWWTTPDPQVEAAFAEVDADGKARIVKVSVDVSREPHRLAFDYAAVPEPQMHPDEREDMMAALALLGVVPEEGEQHGKMD